MDYKAQLAAATRQLRSKGTQVLLTAPVGGIDAPFAADEALPTGVPVYMLSINAGLARYYKFKPSKEEDRPEGALLLLMEAGGPAPQFRSSFPWADGDTYYVRAFDVLAPDGTPLLYFVEATR